MGVLETQNKIYVKLCTELGDSVRKIARLEAHIAAIKIAMHKLDQDLPSQLSAEKIEQAKEREAISKQANDIEAASEQKEEAKTPN